MIEQWILDKIEPHKRAPLIILRDPHRPPPPSSPVSMPRPGQGGDRDGWPGG